MGKRHAVSVGAGRGWKKLPLRVTLGLGLAPQSRAPACCRKDPGQGFGRNVAKMCVCVAKKVVEAKLLTSEGYFRHHSFRVRAIVDNPLKM